MDRLLCSSSILDSLPDFLKYNTELWQLLHNIPHHLLANMYNQYEEEEVSYYLYNAISEKIELVVY